MRVVTEFTVLASLLGILSVGFSEARNTLSKGGGGSELAPGAAGSRRRLKGQRGGNSMKTNSGKTSIKSTTTKAPKASGYSKTKPPKASGYSKAKPPKTSGYSKTKAPKTRRSSSKGSAKKCKNDDDCMGYTGLFCDGGGEVCIDKMCEVPDFPCDPVGACNETMRACTCTVPGDCPSADKECSDDGSLFTGVDSCVNGLCIAQANNTESSAVICADTSDCTGKWETNTRNE